MSDIGQVVKQDPVTKDIEVRSLDELPPHVRASIASIESKEEGSGSRRRKSIKVTLHPKLPALDSIVKMLAYDRAAIEKEMAAQANAGLDETKMIDPKQLDKEGWEAFKILNAKRLEQLGK